MSGDDRSTRGDAAELDSANARRLVDLVFRIREFGIVAVLALLVLVTAMIEPRFVDLTNIQFILVDTTIFALLALGETMVVLTRNVDLSIGSVLGLSAFLSADLFGHHHGHLDRRRVPRRAGDRHRVRPRERLPRRSSAACRASS